MKAWWETLSERERLLVIVGVVAGIAFFGYQLVVRPVTRWQAQTAERHDRTETGYRQVILAAEQAGRAGTDARAGQPLFDTTTPLKSALDASARQAQLIVSSTDGDEQTGVRMTFAPAKAETLYGWLETVRRDYGAVVVEARVGRARTDKSLVQADRLVFRRMPS